MKRLYLLIFLIIVFIISGCKGNNDDDKKHDPLPEVTIVSVEITDNFCLKTIYSDETSKLYI